MLLRLVLAVVAVFLCWAATDVVIHGVMLGSEYKDNPTLFRSPEGGPDGMKMGLIYLVVLAHATIFVKIYSWLISPKSILTGIVYGLLWGVAHGIGMGYATFATMPIPANMATTWCLGAIIQGVLGGVIVAAIIRKRDEPAVGAALP
jgi:hypothetical protein